MRRNLTTRLFLQGLYRAIEKETLSRLSEFDMESLALVLWSFGSFRFRSVPFWLSTISYCMPRLSQFSPHELASIVWSIASVDMYSELEKKAMEEQEEKKEEKREEKVQFPHLWDAFTPELASKMQLLDCTDICNVAFAFSKLGKPPPILFASLEESTLQKGSTGFSFTQLIDILWSFGTAKHDCSRLGFLVEAKYGHAIGSLEPMHLSKLAWSLSSCSSTSTAAFPALVRCALVLGPFVNNSFVDNFSSPPFLHSSIPPFSGFNNLPKDRLLWDPRFDHDRLVFCDKEIRR